MASKIDLYGTFLNMFPDLASVAESYKKVGSRTIMVNMENGEHIFFLYNSPNSWNLGTKQWRSRPDTIPGNKTKSK